ncbi:MAG: hypothetical protein KIS94_15500 [Chitinophagales bacterium]|nr:hypothetical protein [Chitinophagales bacterium]
MVVVLDKNVQKAKAQVKTAIDVSKKSKRKKVNLRKYLGALKTDIDPLKYQKEIRA